ncbi:unnamed protein product [Didymodactylos carnosus]|uniref:Uncharacterized protein n=1 Tax=Didymodactylos carnosus TaxID=1234261 RepID=A0A8S2LLE9_9BILA|nr:unnamed protein product [Didymodactylos carnosus]CAF3912770.1 unnamed protein product [Didymodactylos carnosus]
MTVGCKQLSVINCTPNIGHIHLIDITTNDLSVVLDTFNQQLVSITTTIACEILTYQYRCFIGKNIFNNKNEKLEKIHIYSKPFHYRYHLNPFGSDQCLYIRYLTISSVKCINDLHLIFDHFPSLKYLNIKVHKEYTGHISPSQFQSYDYTLLKYKLPFLTEFILATSDNIEYDKLDNIIKNLIHLKSLSFEHDSRQIIYRNFSDNINGGKLEQTLSHLKYLEKLNFIIKITYDHIKSNYNILSNTFDSSYWKKWGNVKCFRKTDEWGKRIILVVCK